MWSLPCHSHTSTHLATWFAVNNAVRDRWTATIRWCDAFMQTTMRKRCQELHRICDGVKVVFFASSAVQLHTPNIEHKYASNLRWILKKTKKTKHFVACSEVRCPEASGYIFINCELQKYLLTYKMSVKMSLYFLNICLPVVKQVWKCGIAQSNSARLA